MAHGPCSSSPGRPCRPAALNLKNVSLPIPEVKQGIPCIKSFSSYPFTCIVELPTPVPFTSILTGMRRVSCSIWLITPMVLPDNRRLSNALRAASRVSLSSVRSQRPRISLTLKSEASRERMKLAINKKYIFSFNYLQETTLGSIIKLLI
jgi:hypothetical protein